MSAPEERVEVDGCTSSRRSWWIPVGILVALLAVGVTFALLAHAGALPGQVPFGPFPPFWLVFPLGFLLFWVLVVAFVRPWGGWGRGGWGRGRAPYPTPEEIVRSRYARGEISREQMAALLADLAEAPRSAPLRNG